MHRILEQEQHFALLVLQLTESRLLTTLCISREDMSVSRRRSVESAEVIERVSTEREIQKFKLKVS